MFIVFRSVCTVGWVNTFWVNTSPCNSFPVVAIHFLHCLLVYIIPYLLYPSYCGLTSYTGYLCMVVHFLYWLFCGWLFTSCTGYLWMVVHFLYWLFVDGCPLPVLVICAWLSTSCTGYFVDGCSLPVLVICAWLSTSCTGYLWMVIYFLNLYCLSYVYICVISLEV